MIPKTLPEQEEHLFTVLSGRRFLQMEGLGNEVPFFIYPFPPEDALTVAAAKRRVKNRLAGAGVTVFEINLYDLSVELLKERRVWERVLAAEPGQDKDDFREMLQGMLDPQLHIAPAIRDRLAGETFDVFFLTGIGEVFPFAGISFSRFGELGPGTEPGLFVLALGGAVAALVGALGALFVSMSLAAASNVSTKDLVSERPDKAVRSALSTLKKDPALAPWSGDFKDFVADLEAAHTNYQVRLKDWAESVDPKQSGMLVTRASRRLTSLDKTQGVLLSTASYLRLADRFVAARWWFVGWLTLAALGAGAFVWATGTSASESIARATTPATWAVPVSERENISAKLGGSACSMDLRAVPVTILDEQPDGQHADILTNPTPGCRALHLVIPDTQLTRT